MEKTITAYVELLNEGFQTLRQVEVTPLGNDLFRLLGPPPEQLANYEDWAIPPGSTVALEKFQLKYWWAVMGSFSAELKHPDIGDTILLVQHSTNFSGKRS